MVTRVARFSDSVAIDPAITADTTVMADIDLDMVASGVATAVLDTRSSDEWSFIHKFNHTSVAAFYLCEQTERIHLLIRPI